MSEAGDGLGRRVETSLAVIAALRSAIAATPPLADDARLGPDEDAWGAREPPSRPGSPS